MQILLIQVLLIAVVIVVAFRLFRMRGARAQALRRIGLMLFAGFAVVSILVPNLWNKVATIVGVSRGTDVILYGLVVVSLSYMVTVYSRFRAMEASLTRLARRIALDDAQPAQDADPNTRSGT